jgi:hypothetical protein
MLTTPAPAFEQMGLVLESMPEYQHRMPQLFQAFPEGQSS